MTEKRGHNLILQLMMLKTETKWASPVKQGRLILRVQKTGSEWEAGRPFPFPLIFHQRLDTWCAVPLENNVCSSVCCHMIVWTGGAGAICKEWCHWGKILSHAMLFTADLLGKYWLQRFSWSQLLRCSSCHKIKKKLPCDLPFREELASILTSQALQKPEISTIGTSRTLGII